MRKNLSAALFATALSASAARPVAIATTSKAFTLGRVHVDAAAVSSWPLAIGDEMKELGSSAILRFADNTHIVLEKGSSVKLESVDGRTTVRLTAGSMTYTSGPASQVRVFALDKELVGSHGSIAIDSGHVVVASRPAPQHESLPPRPRKPQGRSEGE